MAVEHTQPTMESESDSEFSEDGFTDSEDEFPLIEEDCKGTVIHYDDDDEVVEEEEEDPKKVMAREEEEIEEELSDVEIKPDGGEELKDFLNMMSKQKRDRDREEENKEPKRRKIRIRKRRIRNLSDDRGLTLKRGTRGGLTWMARRTAPDEYGVRRSKRFHVTPNDQDRKESMKTGEDVLNIAKRRTREEALEWIHPEEMEYFEEQVREEEVRTELKRRHRTRYEQLKFIPYYEQRRAYTKRENSENNCLPRGLYFYNSKNKPFIVADAHYMYCLLYTSPSPRDPE